MNIAGAVAGELDDPAALHVRFADLDLGRSVDAATLYRRIQNAARKICSVQAGDVESCTQRAVSQAVKAIDQPILTSQHLVNPHAPGSDTAISAR